MMAGWKATRVETVREYEITDALDLQDTSTTRRRVIRPRKVTVYQVFGTNLVRYAAIEGRQVRRDGELGNSQNILAGCRRWYNAAPPHWLNEILAAHGLEWSTDATAMTGDTP